MESEDEIAIVGIGCNFPGGEGIENFWQVLVEGKNCTVDIPPERFNTQQWYDPDRNKPGKTFTRRAALLNEFNTFDNKLFGIHDLEAERMDPQQKLLLECTYRALEDAGIPRESISGTKTGVFVGLMNRDYEAINNSAVTEINHYDGTGIAMSIAANRISYIFNLTGPSLATDTACSSFFYALHYALHGIRQGDCEAAFCAGVSCIIDPCTFVSLCKANMISPDGTSKPFSKNADGYGRGEGCGVVLLKPLKKAQEDYNKIWGVIKISTVNQDGRSATPITKPSQQQQENLLLGIYPAHVDPSIVQYIEAHGTGTPVGDPTEAKSIGRVIGKKRSPSIPPLKIGSVKGNIGHTESAAGAAGLIKVLLMMHYGKIVPTLYVSENSTSINTKELNLSIPTTVEEWDESSELGRVAGINCFGFGGTNAHVVVRQVKQPRALSPVKRPVELFVISAASSKSLKLTMKDTAKHVKISDSVALPHLAYTSACRRSHMNYKYRRAFVASSLQQLEQQLSSEAEMEITPTKKPPELIFVFSGNGLKLKSVFQTLLRLEPVFRDKCKEIEGLFQEYSSIGILELTESEFQDLSQPEIAQPLLFTLQVALVTLLRYWGVNPVATVGHSVGEIAAAHCAGLVSLGDAVRIIYHRSRLQAKVTGGRMLVVSNIPVQEVSAALQAYSGKICIAAFNSPQSCTLSGDADSISAFRKHLAEIFSKRNIFLHVLDVPVAYHSHMMDPVLQELAESLSGLQKQKPKSEVFSTVTGKIASENDFLEGGYWARQVRNPVFFSDAIVSSVEGKENTAFVEIGPQRALGRYISETLGTQMKVFPSLLVDKPYATLLALVKQLFELGFNPDWQHLYEGYQGAPASYPRYQFDSKKHRSVPDFLQWKTETAANLNHVLVDNVSNGNTEFRSYVSQAATPYLYEHKHNGVALVPGAFFVHLALTAVMTTSRPKVPLRLCQMSIRFTSPCVLSESSHELKVKVESHKEERDFQILSSSGAVYASGQIRTNPEISLEEKSISYHDIFQRCKSFVSKEEIYETLSFTGFEYGTAFKQLGDVFYCEELKEAISTIKVTKLISEEMHEYHIHPVLLDCFLQMIVVPARKTFRNRVGIPSGINSLVVAQPLEEEMMIYMKSTKSADNYLEFCGCFTNKHGSVLVEIKRVRITFVKETSMRENDLLFENSWKEKILSHAIQNSREACRFAVFADEIGVSHHLKKYLHKDSKFLIYEDWEKLLGSQNPELAAQNKIKQEVQDYNDILFMWGIERLNEENADIVIRSLSKCCEAFRQLIIAMREKTSRCSIRLITYRTTDRIVDHINPGFALCGMARSCMAEATEIAFQIIDISSTRTLDISALADVLVDSEVKNYPEIWINEGRIYISEIRHSQGNDTSYIHPLQSFENPGEFTLYTSEPYEARDVFAELSDNANTPLDNNSVEVEIEKIGIHSEDYYPVSVTSRNFGNALYWSSETNDKHKLLALDWAGKVTAIGRNVEKVKVGDRIASCYPLVASSKARVPETVCFNTHKWPCFENVPCVSLFKITWEILHQILPKVKRNGFLGIISAEPESVLCKVLAISAQEAGWKTLSTTVDGSLEQCAVQCNALVFLPPVERLPHHVLTRLSHLQNVVVICSNQHSECLGPLLTFDHENFQVHVLSLATIFQKASLKHSHKPFSHWMKSMRLKNLKILPCSVFQPTEKDEKTDNTTISTLACKSLPFVVMKTNVHNSFTSDIPMYAAQERLFKQNAVYIVTGGLSGLGFETVKFIAQNGGGCIVILSRRKPSAEVQKEINNLQSENERSKIVSLQCNIIFRPEVDRAIISISKIFPKCSIKGVFHSAVVFHDGSIEALTFATFEKVLSPKVAGAINLHHATQGQDLDYFVCYSSITSFLGNAMQANYAAANSFLDLFCHYRRHCGLSGQSINWGALNLGVLHNQSQLQNLLKEKGIEILQVNDFYEYLKICLVQNNPQQAVVKFNFRTLFSQKTYLSRMYAIVTEALGSNLQLSELTMSQDLVPIKPEEYIKLLVSQLSGTDPTDIAMDTPLLSLGMDSMSAMSLRNRIFSERRVDIPIVKLLSPTTTVLSLALILEDASKSVEKPEKEQSEEQNAEGENWSVYL
ncbi:mycocerosic acid synthase [Pogona vitticeps]